jgi:hypothetical protein
MCRIHRFVFRLMIILIILTGKWLTDVSNAHANGVTLRPPYNGQHPLTSGRVGSPEPTALFLRV